MICPIPSTNMLQASLPWAINILSPIDRPVRIMLFPAYYAMLQFLSNLPIMLSDLPIMLRGFTYYAQILNEK